MKFLPLLLLPLISFGQVKLDRKLFIRDDKVEIMVPERLQDMSDEMWKLKYHDLPKPQQVLSDEAGEVNLLINDTKQSISEKQLSAYKEMRIDQLKGRSDIKILSDGIMLVKKKKIGFIKFISQASDQNVFNFYFFTEVEGRVLFISFNCIEKIRKTWEKAADDMMNSFLVH